jgi:hypothetical protein
VDFQPIKITANNVQLYNKWKNNSVLYTFPVGGGVQKGA